MPARGSSTVGLIVLFVLAVAVMAAVKRSAASPQSGIAPATKRAERPSRPSAPSPLVDYGRLIRRHILQDAGTPPRSAPNAG